MFILSPILNGLEIWSVNHISIYQNSELKVFKNTNFLGEIFNNLPNDLLDANVYRLLNTADNHGWQHYIRLSTF